MLRRCGSENKCLLIRQSCSYFDWKVWDRSQSHKTTTVIEKKTQHTLATCCWRPVGRFLFLRKGAIQRGDGPNERRRREPQGGSGGMFLREILKIRLSETAFRAF